MHIFSKSSNFYTIVLPATIPYVTRRVFKFWAKKLEAMPIVINEVPNNMETLQLERLIVILASGPEKRELKNISEMSKVQ